MVREESDTDSAKRSGDDLSTHIEINQAEPTFRPLSDHRASRDQPAPRETTVARWPGAPSHSTAQQPAHRLAGSRPSRDQARSHERERIAAARAQGSGGDRIAHVRSGRNNIALLSFLFAVGIVIGLGATSAMLAPGFSRSVRSLAASAQSNANLYLASSHESGRSDGGAPIAGGIPPHISDPANLAARDGGSRAHPDGDTSEQGLAEIQKGSDALETAKAAGGNAQLDGESSEQKLAEIAQRLDALEKAINARIPVGPPRIAGEDSVPALSVQNAKTGDSGQSAATSPPRPVQMDKTGDSAAVSAVAETGGADRAHQYASHTTREDSAVPSEQVSRSPVEPLPSSAQGAQPGLRDARLRQEFEQFLNMRQQTSSSPQDREKLFAAFKKLIDSETSQANGLAGKDALAMSGSTRRIEIWQAVDTTNLRELASAESTVVGTVAKGSTFRVIDGGSKDGKWLKIKTRDGLTGYYWAARAREMR